MKYGFTVFVCFVIATTALVAWYLHIRLARNNDVLVERFPTNRFLGETEDWVIQHFGACSNSELLVTTSDRDGFFYGGVFRELPKGVSYKVLYYSVDGYIDVVWLLMDTQNVWRVAADLHTRLNVMY